jgi:hypothetical protein
MIRRLTGTILVGICAFAFGAAGCDSSRGEATVFSTIEIDPAALSVEVDNSFTSEYFVTIRNTGTGKSLRISEIRLDYEPATDLEASLGKAFTVNAVGLPADIVPAGQTDGDTSFQFFVRYTRQEDSIPRSGIVTIVNDNSQDTSRQELKILFQTRICEPVLGLPAQVDFLQVGAGEVQEELIGLDNTGSCGLIIDWIRFDGDETFTLTINGKEYDGNSEMRRYDLDPPVEIGPNSSAVWLARFQPVTGEPNSASLIMHTNDSTAVDGLRRVELVANSTGPRLDVVPDPVEFGGKRITRTATIDVELRSSGTAALTITGIALEGGEPDFEFGLDFSTLPGGAAPTDAAPLAIPEGEIRTLRVTYTPSNISPRDGDNKPIPDMANIAIQNNTFGGVRNVPVIGFGVEAECPQPVIIIEEGEEVRPLTTLHLHGEQSQGATGEVNRYNWTVTQPPDNKFIFVPSASAATTTHQVNIGGEYTYCLDVCDAQFCSSDERCSTTVCKKVLVIPDNAILCELTWHTPGDLDEFDEGPGAGSDMDVHFVHPFASGPDIDKDGKPDPWFDIPYDCFWYNRSPDWESMNPNARDDPSLDRDDTDGAGPETVTLDQPVDGRIYRVGVHYWDDHGFGISYPRVKCYVYGEEVFDRDLRDLNVPMYRCDMWEVATITWPQGIVTPVTRTDGTLKITPKYENEAFVSISGGNCDRGP